MKMRELVLLCIFLGQSLLLVSSGTSDAPVDQNIEQVEQEELPVQVQENLIETEFNEPEIDQQESDDEFYALKIINETDFLVFYHTATGQGGAVSRGVFINDQLDGPVCTISVASKEKGIAMFEEQITLFPNVENQVKVSLGAAQGNPEELLLVELFISGRREHIEEPIPL